MLTASVNAVVLIGEIPMSKTDEELQRDVRVALLWEPSVTATYVGVSVKDGVVTLTGHVPSYVEKVAAERAAKRVDGVKAVANEIDVRLRESSRRTDQDLAVAAVKALNSKLFVPADRIKVTVNNGWITLEGDVKWQFQRRAAERAVRNLPGVRGISNNIKIASHVSPADLQSKIEAALKRQAVIDAQHITVDVHGAEVILRGTVRSWSEKQEAERTAWSAPGVTSVNSQIVVAA
jgi:osmotically-inducible protein OsmY